MTAAGFRTVRGRMLCWVLGVTVPIYAAALYLSYQETAARLIAGAEQDADQLAARLAVEFDAVIRPMEGGVRTVARQIEALDVPQSRFEPLIRGILDAWPDVYGSTIAVEAGPGATATPFAPYFFRREGGIEYANLAQASYAYQQLPWYRSAVNRGSPVWSLPYFDAGGGEIWMVTYSVPFFRNAGGGRSLGGVVTADLDLEWMRRAARHVTPGPGVLGWVSSPAPAAAFFAPIGDTEANLARRDPALDPLAVRTAAERMLAEGRTFGLLPGDLATRPAYLAVRNLETVAWRLLLVTPRAELLADARDLLNRLLWLGAIGLVLLVVAISLVAGGIARPIRALAAAVGGAGEDKLDFALPGASRRDEVGVLTEALRRMRDSLQRHVELRAESLARQARLEHELEIAASIQQSMLPRAGSEAQLPAADVAGALLPAKQVGGDLYDYFTLSDGNVLFAIGDVSDKGIPAALFMARLSALLRVLGAAGELPDRLLVAINARLVEGNDVCMFVTLGCGLLDVQSGRVRYASAGHEAPLLRLAEGDVRPLAAENGPAVGIEAAAEYRLFEGFLAPGDALVLYTDGVTDAEADDGSSFGQERLAALLRSATAGEPAALVRRIVEAATAHSSGFRATDDLTVLALRYRPEGAWFQGDGAGWRIAPSSTPAGVRQAQHWVRAILASRGVAAESTAAAELVVEELLTNVLQAAAAGKAVRITLDCRLTADSIALTLRDDGIAFDPLATALPDLDADIAERPVGGLGIALVRRLAAHCAYARTDGHNVLEIRLDRGSGAA